MIARRSSSRPGVGVALALALGWAAAGCAAEDDLIVRPPGGGSGGTGGGSGSDAGTDGGSNQVSGRLCLLANLLAPDACSAGAAGGVTVEGGGRITTTDATGRFALVTTATALVIETEATTTLVAAAVPVRAVDSPFTVPVVKTAVWDDVLASVNVPGLAGQAGIVIYVDDAQGTPLSGAVFAALPGEVYAPLYDAGSDTSWVINNGTGAAGVAMMLGVPAPDATTTYTVLGQTRANQQLTISNVPARADAITFVRVAAE